MTTVFSQALRVLDLWDERKRGRLSEGDLWRKKELLRKKRHPPALSRKSRREFSRYLSELVEHKFLWRRWNPKEGRYYYAKIDGVHRRSFASVFVDLAESCDFHEVRDVLGASVIYSKPALSDFITEKEVESINVILDKANAKIAGRIEGLLQKRKELSVQGRGRQSYASSIRQYAEMAKRFERSGKVETQKEDENTVDQLFTEAKRRNFGTIEEFRSKVGWQFSRLMKDYPLTFDEYKEYQRLKTKILFGEKSLLDIEDQIPKFLCCFWNFEMEEYLLESQNLVLCVGDIVRPVEEVIESLSKMKLLEYKRNVEKALRSGTFHMPQWTGSEAYQPKLRLSWNDQLARKYLKRILMSIDHWLGADEERNE